MSDFSSYAAGLSPAEQFVNEVDSGNANLPIGLPSDPVLQTPPVGLSGAGATVADAPQVGTIQNIWNTIKSESEGAIQTAENLVASGYDTAKNAAGTVLSDVEKPVQGVLTGVYWYAVIAVVVIAGALYYVGKGGAIGQAASFK